METVQRSCLFHDLRAIGEVCAKVAAVPQYKFSSFKQARVHAVTVHKRIVDVDNVIHRGAVVCSVDMRNRIDDGHQCRYIFA